MTIDMDRLIAAEDAADCASSGSCTAAARRRLWWPLGILVAVAAAAWIAGVDGYLSFESLIAHREALAVLVADNRVVAVALFAAGYAAAVAVSLPCGLALTLTGGFLFGPVLGGVASAIGATAGATAVFWVARGSLGESLRAQMGPRLNRLAAGFRRDAFHFLLFLRLVPVAPFCAVNIAPALIGVELKTYVAATALGILPATFAFATVGSGLDSVLAAQAAANRDCLAAADCAARFDPGAVVTPGLIAALAALGVVSLIPVGVKAMRRRKAGRCG